MMIISPKIRILRELVRYLKYRVERDRGNVVSFHMRKIMNNIHVYGLTDKQVLSYVTRILSSMHTHGMLKIMKTDRKGRPVYYIERGDTLWRLLQENSIDEAVTKLLTLLGDAKHTPQ